MIHISDPSEGSGYTYTHDQGIITMQKKLGLKDNQIVRKTNITDTDPTKTETAIKECIEDGCNVIFGTSWGYMDTMEAMAKEYPDVMYSPTEPDIRRMIPTLTTISEESIRQDI